MPFSAAELITALERASVRVVDKPWGSEHVIDAGDFLLKLITVDVGCRTSLQRHEIKREVQFVIRCSSASGVEIHSESERTSTLRQRGPIQVKPGTVHRSVGPLLLIEVTTPQDDDVVRLDDDYGRA